MPATQVRYGRPKGSSLDDSQQLQSIAALLAADPKLKPTTAIKALGVADPSTVRRLRDKFRAEQASLMAQARGVSNENTPAVPRALPIKAVPVAKRIETVPALPGAALFASWCDLGFSALSAAIEAQSLAAQCWLAMPHVAAATRGQMTINAVAIAAYTRTRSRARTLH